MSGDGTKMYCPFCGDVRVCKAFNLTEIGDKEGQRIVHKQYSDLESFQRARECLTCKKIFKTFEIDEFKFSELIKLRDDLASIKCAVNDLEGTASASQQLTSLLVLLQDLQKLSIPWEE